jgi:hypothetical protein
LISESEEKTTMASIQDNQNRPLTSDELESAVGGSLPIPPYHGGPVPTPVIPASRKTPINEPLVPMPKLGQ